MVESFVIDKCITVVYMDEGAVVNFALEFRFELSSVYETCSYIVVVTITATVLEYSILLGISILIQIFRLVTLFMVLVISKSKAHGIQLSLTRLDLFKV